MIFLPHLPVYVTRDAVRSFLVSRRRSPYTGRTAAHVEPLHGGLVAPAVALKVTA